MSYQQPTLHYLSQIGRFQYHEHSDEQNVHLEYFDSVRGRDLDELNAERQSSPFWSRQRTNTADDNDDSFGSADLMTEATSVASE